MLVKIVGIVPQSYTLDNGYSFTGDKVHCIDLETKADKQIGDQVMDFKIPADSHLAGVPLEIGEKYQLYFTKKGAVDFLAKAPK